MALFQQFLEIGREFDKEFIFLARKPLLRGAWKPGEKLLSS